MLIKRNYTKHAKILILGGGAAGTTLSKVLTNMTYNFNPNTIKIVEKNKRQLYQPGLTLLGSNKLSYNEISCSTQFVTKKDVEVFYEKIKTILPYENKIVTEKNNFINYEQLIIASGIKPIYSNVKGLKEALDDENCPIGSIYDIKYAEKYRKLRNNFKGGNAVFQFPPGMIKCPGAPLKILFTSTYDWNKKNIKYNSEYNSAIGKVFGVDYYAPHLNKLIEERNIKANYNNILFEIDKNNRIAKFKNSITNEIYETQFDIMHVGLSHESDNFIKNCSEIIDPINNLVSVNKNTLQSDKFDNIWSFGDVANLPTGKTQSSVNDSVYYLAHNLKIKMENKNINLMKKYEGYTACPLLLGGKNLVMAEFGYEGKPCPSFLKNQQNPNIFFWFLKEHVFHRIHILGLNNLIKPLRYYIKLILKNEKDEFYK